MVIVLKNKSCKRTPHGKSVVQKTKCSSPWKNHHDQVQVLPLHHVGSNKTKYRFYLFIMWEAPRPSTGFTSFEKVHTDETSTCLSGVVRRSGIASHRPLLKHLLRKIGPT